MHRPRCLCVLTFFVTLAFPLLLVAQHSTNPPSVDQVWKELAAGNRRFVSGKTEPRNLVARRQELTKTQAPHVIVLSCSDSRVPPESVFDEGLGDLFVIRTAGETDDPLVLGSVEYAVEHLGSSVIVVMGHQRCGAVTAACSGGKSESANLEAVVDPIANSCTHAHSAHASDATDFAIKDHVHTVATELPAKSEVLKKAVAEGKLTIIEAYYSLDTGEVTRLR